MRLLDQPAFPMVALLLLFNTQVQLLYGGVVPSSFTALANRLGGHGDFFAVLQADGRIFSTGVNTNGQLGLGFINASMDFPQPAVNVTDALEVRAGVIHACIRRALDNQVSCVGNGARIGQTSGATSSVYIDVDAVGASAGVTHIMSGHYSGYAFSNITGQVWAWGANSYGMLGVGSSELYVHTPALISAFSLANQVIQIDSGTNFACYLTEAGTVLCAGSNSHGMLGVNDANTQHSVDVPTAVIFPDAGTTTFTSVSCGDTHACASTTAGQVYCWGSNTFAQQTQEDSGLKLVVPTLIANVDSVRFVWTGWNNVFAVLHNGTALAWGQDNDGVFGGEYIPGSQRTPVEFARGVGGIVELQGGSPSTCILTTQDQVRCVGRNTAGQFGVGSTVVSSLELMTMGQDPPTRSPTAPRTRAPAPPSSFRKRLAGMGSHFLLVQLSGEVFAVGPNSDGQLGLGVSDTSFDSPQLVPNTYDVVDVCAGYSHSCILFGPGKEVACAGTGNALGNGMGGTSHVFVPVVGLDEDMAGVMDIFCGLYTTFAIANATGKAWAWGMDTGGVLGSNHGSNTAAPARILAFGPANKVIQIDSGGLHTCFLTAMGRVLCSGSNLGGMLGVNNLDIWHQVNVPTAVVFADSETTTFTSVSCGYSHTCASDSMGSVWCWGSNGFGQQAQQDEQLRIVVLPTLIPTVQDARFIWCGTDNVFAVLNNGTALTWGRDQYGVFGAESIPYEQRTPVPFGRGVDDIQELQGGHRTTCILTVQNEVQCAGRNDEGQLGVGPGVTSSLELLTMGELITKAPTPARTRAPAPSSALRKRLAGQGQHYLVLQLNGDVFAVGRNYEGQLGLDIVDSFVDFPQMVPDVFDVVDMSAGEYHSCLLLGPGREVMCTGEGDRLGADSLKQSRVFAPTIGLDATTGVTDVFCGAYSTFALNSNTGQVWAWGYNEDGLLGLGHFMGPILIPVSIPGFGELGHKIVKVDSGSNHACFLTDAGKVLCSGSDEYGALGMNNQDYQVRVNVPTAVVFPDEAATIFTSLSCGAIHVCASTSIGQVYCWGSDQYGQQARDGTAVIQPTLISGVQDVDHVWAGRFNVFAVLHNSTALAWGTDNYGLFGGDTNPYVPTTPMTFVNGVDGIVQLQGGSRTTCVLTTQDEVRCVGTNDDGQFGVGPHWSW